MYSGNFKGKGINTARTDQEIEKCSLPTHSVWLGNVAIVFTPISSPLHPASHPLFVSLQNSYTFSFLSLLDPWQSWHCNKDWDFQAWRLSMKSLTTSIHSPGTRSSLWWHRSSSLSSSFLNPSCAKIHIVFPESRHLPLNSHFHLSVSFTSCCNDLLEGVAWASHEVWPA